jgi:hypothetical protein
MGRTNDFGAFDGTWQALTVETERLVTMLRTVCQ